MKNFPLALAMTWAICSTYQLGSVLNEPMTLSIVVQVVGVLLAWTLVKVADVFTLRESGV